MKKIEVIKLRKKVEQVNIYITQPSTTFSFNNHGEFIIENKSEKIVFNQQRFKELYAFINQIKLEPAAPVEIKQQVCEPECTHHVVLNCLLSLKVVRFFERLGSQQQAFVEAAVIQLIEHQEFSVRPLRLAHDETVQTSLKVPLNLLDRIPDFLDRVLFIIGAVEKACFEAISKKSSS